MHETFLDILFEGFLFRLTLVPQEIVEDRLRVVPLSTGELLYWISYIIIYDPSHSCSV
jgi:hypothetical protein